MFEDIHNEAFEILMRRYRDSEDKVRAVAKGAWWVDSETGELIMPYYNENERMHLLSPKEIRSMVGLCVVVEEKDIWEHVGRLRNRRVEVVVETASPVGDVKKAVPRDEIVKCERPSDGETRGRPCFIGRVPPRDLSQHRQHCRLGRQALKRRAFTLAAFLSVASGVCRSMHYASICMHSAYMRSACFSSCAICL